MHSHSPSRTGYEEVPRDIDMDFDLSQNAFEGSSDVHVYGLDNDVEADFPNDLGLDQPPLSPGSNRQSETQIRRCCFALYYSILPSQYQQCVVSFIFRLSYTNCSTHKGRICDEQGNDIPLDARPPLRPSDRGPADWTPYTDRVEFEVADFLYRRNQMSGGDINFIFGLWLLHWHLIVILHLSPITLTCMMPLIQRLSVMFPGRVLVHGTMALCLKMMSRPSG